MDTELPDPVEVVKLHIDYALGFSDTVPQYELECAADREIARMAKEFGLCYAWTSDQTYTCAHWWEPKPPASVRGYYPVGIAPFVRALYRDSGERQLGYLTAKPAESLYAYRGAVAVAGPLEAIQLIHRMIARGHLQRVVDQQYQPTKL